MIDVCQVNDSDLAVVPGANTDADGAPVKKMNVAREGNLAIFYLFPFWYFLAHFVLGS